MRVSIRSLILQLPLSVCLLAPSVYAGELVVNDCNGGLLLWDTHSNGAPFHFTARAPAPAGVSSVVLIPSAAAAEKMEADMLDGQARFRDVPPGTYRLCDGTGAAIAQVSLSGAASPSTGYARVLGGAGVVGAVVGVSLAASSDSSGGTNAVAVPGADAPLPASPDDGSVGGVGEPSKPGSCGGVKKPGGVSASADDDCGVNSSPEPISPYR